jgi:hypothetical protein
MAELDHLLPEVLRGLLSELLDGPPPGICFVLNQGDTGLIGSLARLSAEDASARPGGRSSVAAHVNHVHYGFELLQRWLAGDQQAFANANFAASWGRQQVSEAEWRDMREGLERDVRAWLDVLRLPTEWTHVTLSGAIGIMVHLAYHLGAIRQIAAAAAGPPAHD